MEKEVTVNKVTAPLTHFLVEPFVKHTTEYYVSIVAERETTRIVFSPFGGIHVEENWEKTKEVEVDVGENIDKVDLAAFRGVLEAEGEPADRIHVILEFIRTLFRLFEYLDFAMLEINPFVLNDAGQPVPLDLVAEVDDTAFFKNQVTLWRSLSPQFVKSHSFCLLSDTHRRSSGVISLSLCHSDVFFLQKSNLFKTLTQRQGLRSS
jgi:succinyl-CoA synthetase beta subunit